MDIRWCSRNSKSHFARNFLANRRTNLTLIVRLGAKSDLLIGEHHCSDNLDKNSVSPPLCTVFRFVLNRVRYYKFVYCERFIYSDPNCILTYLVLIDVSFRIRFYLNLIDVSCTLIIFTNLHKCRTIYILYILYLDYPSHHHKIVKSSTLSLLLHLAPIPPFQGCQSNPIDGNHRLSIGLSNILSIGLSIGLLSMSFHRFFSIISDLLID